jgi:hypothetical protein
MASRRKIALALVAVFGLGAVLAIRNFRSEDSPFRVMVFGRGDGIDPECEQVTVVLTNVSRRSHRLVDAHVVVKDGNGRGESCPTSWKGLGINNRSPWAPHIRPHRMNPNDSVAFTAQMPHWATQWFVQVESRPVPGYVYELIHLVLPFPVSRRAPEVHTFDFSE